MEIVLYYVQNIMGMYIPQLIEGFYRETARAETGGLDRFPDKGVLQMSEKGVFIFFCKPGNGNTKLRAEQRLN